jgi:DNA repair protein RecO (recombination protein O)
MQQRVDQQVAYLLHSRPYGDSSVIADLFSLDWGRLQVVAKGVRKLRSKLAGVLQPHQRLLVSWRGRGAMPTLTAAELVGTPTLFHGNMLIAALYVNELLVRTLPNHVPNPLLFTHYHHCLTQLDDSGEIEWNLRLLERDLLEELGYGLNLNSDVHSGQDILSSVSYCYLHGQGAVVGTGHCGGVWVHGETLLALARGESPLPEYKKQAKQLMRYILSHYLGSRPLMSRRLFRPTRGETNRNVERVNE